jgi:hypothetical protein
MAVTCRCVNPWNKSRGKKLIVYIRDSSIDMILAIQLISFLHITGLRDANTWASLVSSNLFTFYVLCFKYLKPHDIPFFLYQAWHISITLISVDITHMHSSMIAEHPWLQNAKKAPNVPLGDIVKSMLKASLHSSMID